MVQIHNIGYSRSGSMKTVHDQIDQYKLNHITEQKLIAFGEKLIEAHWSDQSAVESDYITAGDFHWYDRFLAQSLLFGAIPSRFGNTSNALQLGYDMYFGTNEQPACERSTNKTYNFCSPELSPETHFSLWDHTFFSQIARGRSLGLNMKPILIGPASYLFLSEFKGEKR